MSEAIWNMGLGTITICALQYKHVFKIVRIEKIQSRAYKA